MKLKMSEKNTFSVAEKKEKKVQPSEKYSNYDMDNSVKLRFITEE